MPGPLNESIAGRAAGVAVSEIAVAANEGGDGPEGGPRRDNPRRGQIGVAVLLTAAAIVAGIIGTRASFLAEQASDKWQSSLRTEIKRAAAALNDIDSLYQTELPVAVWILQAQIAQLKLQAAASVTSGAEQHALELEAAAQGQVVTNLIPSSELAGQSRYGLPTGGFDLGKRLADKRAASPALLALDPDVLQAAGDQLSKRAQLLTLALIPTSFSALLGVLAQPFGRRRRLLLAGGTIALAVGVVMGLGMELLA
jgi:hypothetical protein